MTEDRFGERERERQTETETETDGDRKREGGGGEKKRRKKKKGTEKKGNKMIQHVNLLFGIFSVAESLHNFPEPERVNSSCKERGE